MRVCRFAAVVVLAVGLGLLASPGGAGAADTIPPLVTTLEDVLDGVGDVVDSLTSSLLDDSGADVTHASVEYAPGWVRMRVQLTNPINPLRDPRWSDANFVEWSFDTNGDGEPDYSVEFSTENGELYGAIFDATKPDNPSLCDADSASFSAEHGYTLVIDPKCIGNPKTIGYAVEIVLDTNPNDGNAPILSDRVPDQGLRTVAAPVQPGAVAAPAPAPVAPQMVPPTTAAPPSPVAPNSTAPKPASRPVPAAPKPAAPIRAAQPALASHPTPVPAPAVPAAGPQSLVVVTDLPHTGTASQQSALFGLGITLIGAGMLVMTGQKRQMPRPV